MSKAAFCPFPGCLGIVAQVGRYCHAHAHLQAERDQREKERATKRWDAHHEKIDYSWVWHDPRWRRMRAAQLKREPACRRCSEQATTVDHITPHRGDPALAFDPENLQSLCDRCSAAKSREDRGIPSNPYPPSKKRGQKA
jgi:5-methylcytosine-specific restriction enzyme A